MIQMAVRPQLRSSEVSAGILGSTGASWLRISVSCPVLGEGEAVGGHAHNDCLPPQCVATGGRN